MPTPTLDDRTRRTGGLEPTTAPIDDPPGTTGDPQHNDPASIAAWLAAYDALPTPDLTDAEYADLKAIFAEQRAAGLAAVQARAEALERRQP